MNMLLRGMESAKRVNLLLSLTRIRSESAIGALHSYLVNGDSKAIAAMLNGLEQNNFMRALDALNNVVVIIEKVKAEEAERFNNQLSDVNFKKDLT